MNTDLVIVQRRAKSTKFTACATSIFSAASSTNWLNFILSIELVQYVWLYIPDSCAVKLFFVGSGVKFHRV